MLLRTCKNIASISSGLTSFTLNLLPPLQYHTISVCAEGKRNKREKDKVLHLTFFSFMKGIIPITFNVVISSAPSREKNAPICRASEEALGRRGLILLRPWAIRCKAESDIFTQVDDLAVPGAGLRHLDFPVDVQSMFEGLFVPPNAQQQVPVHSTPAHPPAVPPAEPPRVRLYGNEQDILNAYYIYIHYYFPIFPPPHAPIAVDRPLNTPVKAPATPTSDPVLPYKPKSPVTLAISAILALIPHPRDPNSFAPESVLLRRAYAHAFAREAVTSIEAESDLQESVTSPSDALTHNSTVPTRLMVHPLTPTDLEGILALLILSIYEYTQRGNLIKMRHRAGQAYIMAMNLSLHAITHDDSPFAEARRRAWWMTVREDSIPCIRFPKIIQLSNWLHSSTAFVKDPLWVLW
ncbi:uncharacterized protein ARB_04386 [Trichophyton benhamiae CBS 112371]|uniref:C6 finger domain protein n=1 Tax=Arthroderma benhamiae (strain ATCC MYA-4681 / CBS 112371) TaxID=663331 RepID=D4AJD7_ARTBC|nr:uncharacterized protein ARB_04386 [Trichophyton benhamiae CBS 112371]EFE36860.1 conserved hypothetical protein [Trichophyton benhamiae CBS 112371]